MRNKNKCTLDGYKPDRILIFKGYENHDVTENVLKMYPGVEKSIIDVQSLDAEIIGYKSIGGMVDWGKKTLFLGETHKFISQQKGQPVQYCRGPRKIIAISNGCHFSCEYCFMQGTYRGRHPRIKFNLNWKDLLKELDDDINQRRIGTQVYHMGENQDSLAFDYLYPLTKILVPFFASRDARLLLLSKSDCVENLLDLEHNGHTIVSWTMNSDFVTRYIERDTASLEKRVKAAQKVQNVGYPLRLRFDPLLLFGFEDFKSRSWKKRYDRMMDAIFKDLRPKRITLGSFRFHPAIKASTTQRFPDTILFDDNLFIDKRDEDGRYRYKDGIRYALYRYVINGIYKRASDISVGLCKETQEMWDSLGLKLNKECPSCHCQPEIDF